MNHPDGEVLLVKAGTKPVSLLTRVHEDDALAKGNGS